ncbi:response regulator [Sphingomicrobium clamense]|uniref:Response regulator transcription factor n=1 Tax=Sphingomicrobium clamense TaxID=2851013 RepID=A0ABS6V818_9SPHN|nr:response regulator transcription factor [Sphingomicrobium sp. B8]MBW0145699.1 response regulator transcription factor [Sphingomicrobium sp. B8]
MTKPHLLLVEDEPAIRTPLKRFLEREGFRITDVGDAKAARDALDKGAFALAILDIMLPGEDGLSLARAIRAGGELPILFLSARAEDIDRIVGLEMGADDYLTKPFNPRELLARIKAILRRAEPNGPVEGDDHVYRFGPFKLDSSAQTLSRDGDAIALTGGDYRLLLCMVERAGRTLSRDQLLDLTKGRQADPFDRAIDNAVMRLRKKLGEDGPELIKTVHGLGYSFAGKVETA